MAEQHKQTTRYDHRVIPCAIETWGRLGPQLESRLHHIAARAAALDRRMGLAKVPLLPRWRDLLSAEECAAYERKAIEELGEDCANWLRGGSAP